MSFESTSTSIKNLSGRDKITLDLLFEMMVCVAQDIQKYNNVTDLSVTPVGDQSVLLKNACNVMQLALSAYTKNKEGMSEYSSSIQERFAIVADDMKKALSEAEELKKRIEDGEAKERELETKRDELELSRGHLLKVGEECDDLQRQIDILSDSALDKKAEEKKKLDAELSQRTIKADNLDKDIGKLRTGNEALKNSINGQMLNYELDKEQVYDVTDIVKQFINYIPTESNGTITFQNSSFLPVPNSVTYAIDLKEV